MADRITSVEQMKDVVDVTKNLFSISKVSTEHGRQLMHHFLSTHADTISSLVLQETAKLEAEAFTLKQQVAIAAELKTVLDSWARYEQQQKESEQAELSKSVIDKVLKSLSDEKTQKDILLGAVAEIERACSHFRRFFFFRP